MVQQFFGNIEMDGVQCDAALFVDGDRPGEAMIHWWATSPSDSRAILVRWDGLSSTNLAVEREFGIDAYGQVCMNAPSTSRPPLAPGLKAHLVRQDQDLVGGWSDETGRSGKIVLKAAANHDRVVPTVCDSWEGFKVWVGVTQQKGVHAYRGHGSSKYELQTTLQRAGRYRIERYCDEVLPDFRAHAEVALNRRLNLNDGDDYATLLALAQHHGLPTPLLDWTLSPYVASFFAFTDALDHLGERNDSTHIRVYGLHSAFFQRYANARVVLPYITPYIAPLSVSGLHNPRLRAQQGLFLVTNAANVEHFLIRQGRTDEINYLYAADVPISCSKEALRDLELMGLNAATMFPGLDGVCRMLKQKLAGKTALSSVNVRQGAVS